VKITFLVPSAKRPIGGVIASYQFANGLSRRGHEVHLIHLAVLEGHIAHLGDLAWFRFEPEVQHRVMPAFDATELPAADFIELTALRFFTDSDFLGSAGPNASPSAGLPFIFVQSHGIFPAAVDNHAFRTPGPKICVSRWLMDAVEASGVPRSQISLAPCGIDHETFRVKRSLADRGMQVAMLYNSHPQKNPYDGLLALEAVRRRIPALQVAVFGTDDLPEMIPAGFTYVQLPSRRYLVDEIYNRSRVFVCSSFDEGFGLCAVEAMACGCALATTDNGGSAEYAVDGDNALVCAPGDVAGMVDHIERLVRDDDLRIRVAERGRETVRRFDWDVSASKLEDVLRRYGDSTVSSGPDERRSDTPSPTS
jgi:L-malate glycosyltransferase